MDISIDLSVKNCAVRFDSILTASLGTLQQGLSLDIDFEISFSGESNYGYALIPRLGSIGGVIPPGYGVSTNMLPRIESVADGGAYVPPEPEYGFAYLPYIVSFGTIKTSRQGTASATLKRIVSKGGIAGFGEGTASLPSLVSYGLEGYPSNIAYAVESVRLSAGMYFVQDFLFILLGDGTLASTFTGSREVVAEIAEHLHASSTYTTVGEYVSSLMSSITGSTVAQAIISHAVTQSTVTVAETGTAGTTVVNTVGPNGEIIVTTTVVTEDAGEYTTTETVVTTYLKPGISIDSRVWVVNLENRASSQYDDYGFNSFFERDGEYYGVADDGIYRLDGDSDNGFDINALIQTGRSSFSQPHKKRVDNVYVGVSSTGKMLLKVDADEQVYVYEARSSSTEMKNHRIDVGKGLSGNYYDFTLFNQDGCDFDIETVTFEPLIMQRKI